MTAHRGSPAIRRAAALAALLVVCAAGVASAHPGPAPRPRVQALAGATVVVRARPGHETQVAAAIARTGGSVRGELRIVDGFAARVPRSALAALRRDGSVLSVTPNSRLKSQGVGMSTAYDPSTDGYSMDAITQLTGAQGWWKAGYTGRGVDVAVIDSGVCPLPGLPADRLVNGPDLSLESQADNLRYLDTYGHGTFIAGLIAGHDDLLVPPYDLSPATVYKGMAPDARIVSVKVATADGGTDVVQVIAAIDWVVQHREDHGLNIRVLNLSYGTNSLQDYRVDPLAFAVEQAWKHGIVVVAAAGNTGFQKGKGAPGMADPAYDPYVIGVAASDTMGTPDLKDDVVASYSASSSGGRSKRPDFTAPGSHMQGLRVPNSFIDANHPEGSLGARYFRGSGTSEAAAITSGAVALVLQKHPDLTPDEVKRFFQQNAFHMKGQQPAAEGQGELRLAPMLDEAPGSYTQSFQSSGGDGTLEGARGEDHISRDGVLLSGERDIFGLPVDTDGLAAAEAAGNSWSGGSWNGSSWSGNSWSGNSWSSTTWTGSSWSGSSWSSSTWAGNTWSGSSWSGSSWSGSSWSGNSWTDRGWVGAFWG